MSRRSGQRRYLAAAVVVVLVAAGTAIVLARAGGGSAVELRGSVLGVLARSRRLGPLPAGQVVTVDVVLSWPAEQTALASPGPPGTPPHPVRSAPSRLALGAPRQEIDAVASYLRGRGLSIGPSGRAGFMVAASGAASAVEPVFGTSLSRWEETRTGRTFFANDRPIRVPGPIAADVSGVLGLDDYVRLQPLSSGDAPDETGGVKNLLKAATLPRWCGPQGDQPCDGSGVTVAIFAAGGFNLSDIDQFDQSPYQGSNWTNLAWPHLSVETPAVYPSSANQDITDQLVSVSTTCPDKTSTCGIPAGANKEAQEAEIDVETVHSVAPGAAIDVFESAPAPPHEPTPVELIWFIDAVLQSGDQVADISYANCQSYYDSQQLTTLDEGFGLLARAGVSVFAGSGDTGRNCTGGTGSGVNYPASDPYVTSVGGVEWCGSQCQGWSSWEHDLSGGGYIIKPLKASGGGVSQRFGTRLPDVSGLAVGNYYVWASGRDGWTLMEGSSLAAPDWAAFAAVVDQYGQSRGVLGFLGSQNLLSSARPWIDYVEQHGGWALPALTDVTANGYGTGLLYQQAAKGWDGATGWGMMSDLGNFLQDLVPTLTVTASSVPGGLQVSFTGSPYVPGDTVEFGIGSQPPAGYNYTVLPSRVICQARVDSNHQASCTGTYRFAPGVVTVGGRMLFAAYEVGTPGIGTAVSRTVPVPGLAVVPSPHVHGALASVACASPASCVAVGDMESAGGVGAGALAERWDGTSWSVTPTGGVGAASLSSVSCPESYWCMAVGPGGAATWNGRSWSAVPVDSGVPSTLSSVDCLSSTSCWAVGVENGGQSPGPGDKALVESWDGHAWGFLSSLAPPGTSAASLSSVTCPSADFCVAVGDYRTSATLDTAMAETWDGHASAWSLLPIGQPAPESSLSSVTCTSPSFCMAVGGYSTGPVTGATLVATWDGRAWSVIPSASPTDYAELQSVSCIAANSCLAVGQQWSVFGTGGLGTLVESWDGHSWSVVPGDSPPDGGWFSSVACLGTGWCAAVGQEGFKAHVPLTESNAVTASPTPTPSPTGLVRVSDCGTKPPVARPAKLTMDCHHDRAYLESIQWHQWTSSSAAGTAVWWQDDCVPACSTGHYRSYGTVTLILSDVQPSTDGPQFTLLTVSDGPPGAPSSIDIPLYAQG